MTDEEIYIVKTVGTAQGKGVVVITDLEEAMDAVRGMVARGPVSIERSRPFTETERTLNQGSLQIDLHETNDCDGCGRPIVVGQHYLRMAVMVDTAGMHSALDTPTVSYSAIVCLPQCLIVAASKAIMADAVFEPFLPR